MMGDEKKGKKLSKEIKGWGEKYVTECYLFFMWCVFPLVVHDYYFDITYTKYNFLIKVTIAFAIVAVLVREMVGGSYKRIFCTPPFIFYWLFLLVGLITTLISEYRWDSFWGTGGRYNGWFTFLIYGLAFVIIIGQKDVSIYMIYLFELASVLVAGLGILNYFSIDPFGFFTFLEGETVNTFTSTMGNIDVFGEYVSIFTTIVGVLAVKDFTSRKVRTFHEMCYIVGIFALITNRTDSAYIGLLLLFVIVPIFLSDYVQVKRWLRLLIYFIVLSLCVGRFFSKMDGAKQLDGISLRLCQNYVGMLIILCVLLFLYVFKCKHLYQFSSRVEGLRKIYVFFLVSVVVVLMFAVIAINTFVRVPERYSFLNLLKISDMSGSGRGLLWRVAWEAYGEMPILQKIFGTGADTLKYIFEKESSQISILGKEYDNVHNLYLQLLVGQGILGLVFFATWLLSAWKKMLDNIQKHPVYLALLIGTMVYFAEAMVGIHLINSSAIAMLMMAFAQVEIKAKRRGDTVCKEE